MNLTERIEKFESDRPMLYGLLKEQVGTTGIEALFTYLMNTLNQRQVEPEVKPASDVIKIIDEMIATSIQIEAVELDAGEDCDNEILIDHQGRIYALTQLKNRLLV